MVLTKASFAFVNRGGDLAKACSKHPDRPSATMCHQCHRPVCKTCTIVTPHGSFCSSECSIQNREFKERMRTGEAKAPSGGMAIKLFLFLLLVILGVAGIHMAAKKGIAPARSIDIIGILFEKVEAAKSK
jgi:hypothetical protein